MRDLQLPGRSVVHGRLGAAATSSPLATLAAIDALQAGGSAADAAVAACAVQCVVEPMSTGVGGDCFALLWSAREKRAIGLNGSGRAPMGLTAEWLLAQGHKTIGTDSVHSVTVPGAVAAWDRLLADHGRLGLGPALAPAIRLAAEGFAVTPRVAVDWRRDADRLAKDKNATRIFLPGGKIPLAGEVHRQPELAETLRAIAREGRDGFYKGPVAADIVGYLQSQGGRHSLEDFARHSVDYVDPISTRYRGVDVLEIPPNGQGITTLLMLNILSGFDLARLDPHGAERFHLEAEAGRIAFAVRDEHVADPAFAPTPVKKILSADYAAELRARIDPERAMPVMGGATSGYRDTVYISVVDSERNACSFINSLFFRFGCALVSPATGVVLHCRGAGFRVEPGHPNCVAPGKRPMHTIIPALAMKDGRPWLSFGVMGGGYQPVGQAHVLTNMLDYGMDPQEAIDSPRCFHVYGALEAERGVSDATAAGLSALGHRVVRPDMPWGGGQAIAIDHANGTLAAGSDPRRDGCALAY